MFGRCPIRDPALAHLSFDAGLSGSSATCFAYTVNVEALPCPCEFCFGRYSLNHFSSSIVVEILDVATLEAD